MTMLKKQSQSLSLRRVRRSTSPESCRRISEGGRSSYGNNVRAFTLIEIMVVVSVVTIAFISIVGLVQKTMMLYYDNKNVLIANNLAQEGLELVRFVRDDNWMTPKTYPIAQNYFARSISVDSGGLNPTDSVGQRAGNKLIFTIDSTILDDSLSRLSITPFYSKFDTVAGPVAEVSPNPGCLGVIKNCLKLPAAKIYRDETTPTNIVHRYLSGAPTATQFPTGFNRIIVTEYRDPNNTPMNFADDYLHVESWVYWSDHGKDKFFHLDTDLYDYTWRYQN
ncbi:MAG TPA: prepilin-type N-terminal cleavage/methylation domain-containing protein [bacterium]|nr:prepilin-type N-terminal cleavage/methylation domain-containing protein [bacterium]